MNPWTLWTHLDPNLTVRAGRISEKLSALLVVQRHPFSGFSCRSFLFLQKNLKKGCYYKNKTLILLFIKVVLLAQ